MVYTPEEIAQSIDHTLLKPEATESQIINLCQEAREYGFKTVCIQPVFVELCVRSLMGSGVDVATVVGFPHGANCGRTKAFEAELAFSQGAREADMVINIGALKDGKEALVRQDIRGVVEASLAYPGTIVKVIIETALLTREEKITACRLSMEAGAHFVKTSTGFAGGGATLEDVLLMVEAVGMRARVKASGGIKSREQAIAFLAAGAHRLGTSNGVIIIKGDEVTRGQGY